MLECIKLKVLRSHFKFLCWRRAEMNIIDAMGLKKLEILEPSQMWTLNISMCFPSFNYHRRQKKTIVKVLALVQNYGMLLILIQS